MGSVPTAAQDPIFYLHHCNIDRLWDLWLAQGGQRIDPVFDNTRKNIKYTFFDEEGALVEMIGCEILRAALQHHYVYEREAPQVVWGEVAREPDLWLRSRWRAIPGGEQRGADMPR